MSTTLQCVTLENNFYYALCCLGCSFSKISVICDRLQPGQHYSFENWCHVLIHIAVVDINTDYNEAKIRRQQCD